MERPSTAGSFAVEDELETDWESASEEGTSDTDSIGSLGDVPPPPPPPTIDPASLRSVHKLTMEEGGEAAEFYIVGTAHVSRDSCDDVSAAIQALRPQVVLVELCAERAVMLRSDAASLSSGKSLGDALRDWRSGRASLLLAVYAWMLGAAGDALEAAPGEEFRVAVREAATVGAKVVLGDRPVSITLARTWAALSPWARLRFLWELVWTGFSIDADELKKLLADVAADGDAVTAAILEMGAAFPTVLRPLLYERDEFMVHVCRSLAGRGVCRAVCVVGAGHVAGMRKVWTSPIDVEEITAMPVARSRGRWLVAGLVVSGAAVAGFLVVRGRRK